MDSLPKNLSDIQSSPPFDLDNKITILGNNDCVDCFRAKEFFKDNHVEFKYLDLEKEIKAREWVASFSQVLPVIVFPDKSILYEPSNEDISQKIGISKEIKEDNSLYDVAILGGGPAAIAAAIYSARKNLQTILIATELNGQSVVSGDIRNWIGEVEISGLDLAKKLESHLDAYKNQINIHSEERILNVVSKKSNDSRICDFEIKTDKSIYFAKAVIIATGARRRRMGIPGEDKLEGKGVAFCSTCDAPVFAGKKVAVIGGGNAGLETVKDLYSFASEVYILEFGDFLRGDPKTVDEIKNNPKLKEIILKAKVLEVIGDQNVTGIKYLDQTTNQEKVLEVEGVFVEIGSIPNSEMVKDLVQIDENKEIMVNFQFARTSHPGVFAAGDVTNDPYKQNNIAVGDGVRAALSAYNYLQNIDKKSPAAEK